jgi:superoxide dismutase, Cu-Zn family
MKRALMLAIAVAVTCAAGIAVAANDTSGKAKPGSAVARLNDQKGNVIGTVWFLPRPGGKLAVRASLSWLGEGFHGFHVHAVGKCETPFTTAGPHLNPTAVAHGSHAGDLSPLAVGKNGTTWLEFQTDRLTVDELMDADGSAVVVHASPDNLANIPARYHSHTPDASSTTFGADASTAGTGDSGDRIACGVVQRGPSG